MSGGRLLGTGLLAFAILNAGCGGGSSTSNGTGGSSSTGGTTSSGGQPGTGGLQATGGARATGGVQGTGGITATGGVQGTGGSQGTGGLLGTGGTPATGGTKGTGGVGGLQGTGGTGGAAGSKGTGGAAGSKGTGGVAGSPGTGGTAGTPGGVMSAGCGTQGKQTLISGAQSVSGVSTASRISIQSGTQNREFIIDIPANYDSSHPYRLVFAYHWVGANDTIIATGNGYCNDPAGVATLAGEYYGLKALATANDTIFVAPNGIGGSWSNSNQSDVAFTQAMVDEIEKDLCIDTSRIFSMGFSFGASMTYTLACAKPNVFKGVAILDGSNVISNPPSPCSQPIAYLQIHGINDGDFSITGTAEVMRNKFIMNNGCTQQTVANVANGSHTHACTTYMGCSAGHPLEWCSFDGIHQACEYDGASGDSVQKSWVPGEVWKFFTQF